MKKPDEVPNNAPGNGALVGGGRADPDSTSIASSSIPETIYDDAATQKKEAGAPVPSVDSAAASTTPPTSMSNGVGPESAASTVGGAPAPMGVLDAAGSPATLRSAAIAVGPAVIDGEGSAMTVGSSVSVPATIVDEIDVQPGAYRVYPGERLTEAAGFNDDEYDDGYENNRIDIEAPGPGNDGDDGDDDERIATELERLGIPYVEAHPVMSLDGSNAGAPREEEEGGTLNAASEHRRTPSPTPDTIQDGGGDGDSPPDEDNVIIHAKHLPTVSIFGHKIHRTTATLGACLLAVLATVAIAVPVGIYVQGKETPEDPAEVARKERLSKVISELSINNGDDDKDNRIDNISSPRGKAFLWMLGEDNAHLDDDDDGIKQRFALSVFYYSTGGDTSWTEKGNWLSKDNVCEWSELMVGCDDTDDVTELLLANNGLQGKLPQELPYLNRLEHLNLTRNQGLSGTLLPEIGELSFLETLDLSGDSFEGKVPITFVNLEKLTHLDLANNALTGMDWSWIISHLTNLRHLDVGKNKFAPEEDYLSTDRLDEIMDGVDYENLHHGIFDLTLLEYLDLSENDLRRSPFFQFEIPPSIGNLVNLRVLNMASSGVGVMVPTEIGKLMKLEELTLSRNAFGNSNREDWWLDHDDDDEKEHDDHAEEEEHDDHDDGDDHDNHSDHDSLNSAIDIPFLEASPGLPSELGQLKELKILSFESTSIGGKIPTTLGELTKLENLNLNYAGLTGQIPQELGRLKNVVRLQLGGNSLSGAIPPGIFHENIEDVLIPDNKLSGSLPTEIGNAVSLRTLWLGSNLFEGPVPSEIGNMTSLDQLYLYDNMLTSSLPDTIGNLVQLHSFEVDGNGFTGEIPSSMGNLKELVYFHAADNAFGGPLPTELGRLTALEELGLPGCGITGRIPTEMGNLVDLYYLALDDNKFSGPLPSWMGTELLNLEYLILGRNKFEGNLPVEWSKFPKMINIQAQQNYLLTGTIPKEWANITTLTGLFLDRTNLTGSASFLCHEDLGNNTCVDCGLKVDLSMVECECCTCCGTCGCE